MTLGGLPDPLRRAFTLVALCVVAITGVAAGTLWLQAQRIERATNATLPGLIALSRQALVIEQVVSEMAAFPQLDTPEAINAHAAALSAIIAYIDPLDDLPEVGGHPLADTRAEAMEAVEILRDLLLRRVDEMNQLTKDLAELRRLRTSLIQTSEDVVRAEARLGYREGESLAKTLDAPLPKSRGPDWNTREKQIKAFIDRANLRATQAFDAKTRSHRLLTLLTAASTTDTLDALALLKADFETTTDTLYLSAWSRDTTPLGQEKATIQLKGLLENLRPLGEGEGSIFARREHLIGLDQAINDRLRENQHFAKRMTELSSAIVTQSEADYRELNTGLSREMIRDVSVLGTLALLILVILVVIAHMTHRALSARENSLREALDRAEQANSAKSNFLANMSHELRTPLNAIIGFSDMMAERVFGPLGHPKYTEYMDDIRRSARHLLGLINELLDLARIESGKESLREEWVSIPRLAADCLRLTASLARARHVATLAAPDGQTDIGGETFEAFLDLRRMRQVLLNLIGNAIKFTNEGGQVRINWKTDGNRGLVLSVSDTGRGMTPEQVAIALQPFAKLDADHRVPSEGTGLGLPIATALVREHGGRLAIQSRPGQGTTVTVTLPGRLPPTGTPPRSHDAP
jgi:signal transduction histidine kinase